MPERYVHSCDVQSMECRNKANEKEQEQNRLTNYMYSQSLQQEPAITKKGPIVPGFYNHNPSLDSG